MKQKILDLIKNLSLLPTINENKPYLYKEYQIALADILSRRKSAYGIESLSPEDYFYFGAAHARQTILAEINKTEFPTI